MFRVSWAIQQVIPPALLSYFGWAFRRTTNDVPAYISNRPLRDLYLCFSYVSIPAIALLFLKLYFLPSNQSTPPQNPPQGITSKSTIFECLSPAEASVIRKAEDNLVNRVGVPPAETAIIKILEDSLAKAGEPLVNRCWKGKCNGRWKPARARHCSECGRCRAGFDHHCAFFANCLTAPHIPTFLLLVLYTPLTTNILSLPLYLPLFQRAIKAYRLSWTDEAIRNWWYGWKLSWIIAGGPVGRYMGGIILGWRELDMREEGGGVLRLEMGLLVGLGMFLGMITAALAYTSITLISRGHLTIDRERHKSHSRALHAIRTLEKQGKDIPQSMRDNLERWADRRWFFVPVDEEDNGVILPTLDGELAYDLGRQENWELILGKGWGWLLPWNALLGRRGMGKEEIMNWPIAPTVEKRLRSEALRVWAERASSVT